MTTNDTRRATKVRRLVDATVEADLSRGCWWRPHESPERYAKELERLVKEFYEHVRDHRSLDYITLTVNRVVEDQCSVCGGEWETADDGDGPYCANCGAPLEATP